MDSLALRLKELLHLVSCMHDGIMKSKKFVQAPVVIITYNQSIF